MSQAPAGKNEWITGNYEKVALFVGLLALMGSCAWLLTKVGEGSSLASSLTLTGDTLTPKGTGDFDDTLAQYAAFSADVPVVTRNVSVSERRVSCVSCGRPIPFDAMVCPFCTKDQPEIIDASKTDSDLDGIPDIWEKEWGLNASDPSDALRDDDGDGFSNVEEFTAGTNPKDAGSRPPLIVKLRVAGRRATPFYLKFVGKSTIQGADGTSIPAYQLNLANGDRSHFLKLHDTVQGYQLTQAGVTPNGIETVTLVRRSDGRTTRLVKGRPVTDREIQIRLVSLADRKFLPPVRLNDVFSFDGKTYKVIDITREGVLIQNAETAERLEIPKITPAERLQASGRSTAAPAAASSALVSAPR